MNQSLKIDPYGFREYDARWLYEKDINAEGIVNLGKGLGTQIIENTKMDNPRVIVGHDYRSYSEEIKIALKKGLLSTGCFVEDIGLSLSPMVYFAQFKLNADAVAMVTASHNENGWTGIDKDGRDRTAVCCLSSLNLEKYDEWKDDPNMIEDVMRFLDNVLSDFINKAPDQFKDAKYSAERERSVGLGVMGFHSFLQKNRIPLESVMAKSWNKKIFKQIDEKVNQASKDLAEERGACPDAEEYGFKERFSNKTAIAPTASISIICGGASPGVEPIAANSYTHKTLSGSFNVRNRYLEEILEGHGKNDDETWSTITTNQGSVSHLDFLTDLEKDVFKTAFELNQKWIIELSGDRTPYISQAQSVNLFLPADVHKKELHRIHFDAWKKGLKSLYYCRSKSIQRAENINNAQSTDITANVYKSKNQQTNEEPEYEECLSCQ